MTRPLLVVSTCGTSLLTNGAGPELRQQLARSANATERDLAAPDREAIEGRLAGREGELLAGDLEGARRLSAELNGLAGLWDGPPSGGRDLYLLLHTDTFQGVCVARALERWLSQQRLRAQRLSFPDLRTSCLEEFQVALPDVVRWCEETLPGYRESGYQVVFNLTGGFKSINGFMQALGMFYADQCVYLFEGTRELLRIPRLPLTLDAQRTISEHLGVFRRLGQRQALPASACREIPETLLHRDGEQVVLSAWGDLVWARCRRSALEQGLLEPLSPHLMYTEKLRRSCAGLPRDRLALVNERLDRLARLLETRDERDNPASLNFKPLQGSPCPPSTHEAIAWSDRDARRLVGHYEGERFVVDDLIKHL